MPALAVALALFAAAPAPAAGAGAPAPSPAAASTEAVQTTRAAGTPSPRGASALDLERYARLLEVHTRATTTLAGTEVDYAGLVGSRDLDQLVAQIEASKPSQLDRAGRLAFWINAYNILTLDLVRKHHPLASIKDIGSFFSPVWQKPVARIEGRSMTLDTIEHAILRPIGEPRIHAAIVCASKSCPPLRRTPFRPETLDADLEDALRRFLASPGKGIAIDRKTGVIRVSKIFDWFEEDFAAGGGVRAFLAAHLPRSEADWLRSAGRDAELRYFDYDWSLNGR
ncbi:DUF547 domain-containing protein [Myxococcota bacterium]|nr:DUF547 domain-containing protein [Myxococcota bacterium]